MKQFLLLIMPLIFIVYQVSYSAEEDVNGVNYYSWSPNGKILALEMGGDMEKDIYTYELASKRRKFICKGYFPEWISDIELMYCDNKGLKAINLKNGTIRTIAENAAFKGRYVVSPNKKLFASMYREGKLKDKVYSIITVTKIDRIILEQFIVYVQIPTGEKDDIIDIIGWINDKQICVLKADNTFGLINGSIKRINILNHTVDEYYHALGKVNRKIKVTPFRINKMTNNIKGNRFSFDGKYYAYLLDDMSGEIEIKTTNGNGCIRKIAFEGTIGSDSIKWSPKGNVLAYLEYTIEKSGVLRIMKVE